MDSQGGWRWQLRPDAQPVSYLDPSGQWVSGSFDTAVKSEHGAVRSSGVQPQATAGQVPQLPSQTIHQLQSDVNRHEQAELRRQESGAAPQPMPTAVYQAPPPTDSDEADGGYRRQRDRQLHTQFTPSSMSTPQATSPPYQQPAMQWPPPPYHGGPKCAAGAESMRAPSHQHQWTTSPYQSTGIPTSARLSQAHSTAPVTVPVTVPFPPAHAVPPPPPHPFPFPFGAEQGESSSLSDVGSSHASHCTSIPSAVSTAAAKTTGGAPRSAVEVASGKKVHECHLLADACCFPKGPIQGKDKHVEEAVKMWARDCTKGGGGHGIRKAGPTFAKSRGCRLRFQCAKDPNRTEDCKWECSFEESATGWILVHAVWEHNGHALLESAPQVMAARGTAFLPDELTEMAETAAASGFSIKDIHRLLTTGAEKNNLPVTWQQTHLRSGVLLVMIASRS